VHFHGKHEPFFIVASHFHDTYNKREWIVHLHGYIGYMNEQQHNTHTFSVFLDDMYTMLDKY